MAVDPSALATPSSTQQQYSIAQQIQSLRDSAALLASIGLMKVDPGRIPGPVVIPNCAQVRIFWLLGNGKTATNVIHGSYATTFTPTVGMANTLYGQLQTNLTSSALIGQLHTSTSLLQVGIRDLSAAHTTEFLSNASATPGTGTGTALPPQTSLVITVRTGLAGQAGRGRVYQPGFASVADIGNGTASSTATGAATTWGAGLITALNVSGVALTMCIAHPARAAYTGKTGTAHPARAAGTVPVTSVIVENNVWDTQRRRAEP